MTRYLARTYPNPNDNPNDNSNDNPNLNPVLTLTLVQVDAFKEADYLRANLEAAFESDTNPLVDIEGLDAPETRTVLTVREQEVGILTTKKKEFKAKIQEWENNFIREHGRVPGIEDKQGEAMALYVEYNAAKDALEILEAAAKEEEAQRQERLREQEAEEVQLTLISEPPCRTSFLTPTRTLIHRLSISCRRRRKRCAKR